MLTIFSAENSVATLGFARRTEGESSGERKKGRVFYDRKGGGDERGVNKKKKSDSTRW